MLTKTAFGMAAVVAATVALSVKAQGLDDGRLPPRLQRPPTISELTAQAQRRPAERPDLGLINDIQIGFVPSTYWLGVIVSRPPADVQEGLKLPKDQGLLVERVLLKSPAEKAGIKEDDVLLKANGKPLGDIRDLPKVINDVKEGKLTLELLRGGKHETVVASLVKRPADQMPEGLTPEARDWLKRFAAKMKEGQPLRVQVLGPGQIVPQAAEGTVPPDIATIKVEVSLADGSQIEITRSGDNPAKAVVTRGKERWEGTSDDLSKIPEKARLTVERLLQAPTDHLHLFVSPAGSAQGSVIFFGGASQPNGVPGAAASEPNAEKRLAEMQKQIDDLKQQVKALQGKAKKQ